MTVLAKDLYDPDLDRAWQAYQRSIEHFTSASRTDVIVDWGPSSGAPRAEGWARVGRQQRALVVE